MNNNPSTNTGYYKNYNVSERSRLSSLLLQETNKSYQVCSECIYTTCGRLQRTAENNLVSALAEVGFMNNPNDLKLVVQIQFEDAAYGMLKGIVAYFNK